MQWAQYRAAVYRRIGVGANDGLITPDVVDDAILSALRHIETVRDWWWLEATETLATVAGTATVTPNARSQRTRSLAHVATGYGFLEQVPLAQIRAELTSGGGRPERWAENGSTIVLDPVPDAVYSLTHDYMTTEQPPVDDTSGPLLPDRYADAAVEYAAHIVFRRSAQPDRAAEAFGAYQDWQGRMVDNARRSTMPKLPRVREGAWF